MAVVLFWLSVALILYHHAVYPFLLHSVAQARRRRAAAAHGSPVPLAPAEFASLTVIVPAHNEAAVIASKIYNLAALNYPSGKLRLVLALDGCTDETKRIAEAAIAATSRQQNFEVSEYLTNIGKVAVLNSEISKARSEIIALSDASAIVNADAAIAAARHFVDALVGVVCGTYSVSASRNDGERAYWRYQTQLKADEGALAAPMGAHGAFYVFRRSFWSPLPPDTINDDFVLPMKIALDGHRIIYDPSIVASELEHSHTTQEFRRRVRIGAGNVQQVLRLAKLGAPGRGWLAFIFLSGKGLRAILPFVFVVAFCANAVLALDGVFLYQATLAGQLSLIALAALAISPAKNVLPRRLSFLWYFVLGHVASAVGAVLVLTGKGNQAWGLSLTDKRNRGKFA